VCVCVCDSLSHIHTFFRAGLLVGKIIVLIHSGGKSQWAGDSTNEWLVKKGKSLGKRSITTDVSTMDAENRIDVSFYD
jgi:hypothetical protein